jgi:hypothetical protein
VSRQEQPRAPVSQRLVVIGTAVVAMGVVLLAIERTSSRQATVAAPAPVVIVSEADRSPPKYSLARASMLMWSRTHRRRRTPAHRRIPACGRINAPHVPHGLTAVEFRTTAAKPPERQVLPAIGATPGESHPQWSVPAVPRDESAS